MVLHALILATAMQATGILSRAEFAMLADINATRARAGLPSLRMDHRLTAVATRRAFDMVRRRYFAHTSPEGITPFQRLLRNHIMFSSAAENLALAADEQAAFEALIHSGEHLANILERNFNRVGIAAVIDRAHGGVVFVQLFTN